MTERLLAGAALLGEGPDPNWVDHFSSFILSQDYDTAREVLRGAVSKGVSSSLAEQYAKVLEDFLQKRDEVEHPIILARHDQCIVRQTANQGRGLFAPSYQTWGAELWKQRPLACIQSGVSRRCVQVCRACLLPVGTLASQLRYLGLDAPPGSEEIRLTNGDQLSQEHLPKEGFVAGQVLPCTGDACAEVFCSEACRAWALSESSHALLCAGRLAPSSFEALQSLEQLADDVDQEHLLLLAHTVAQMILARKDGFETSQVKHRFAYQFASAPWSSLADTAEDAQARDQWFAQACEFLGQIFPAESEFLEPNLLSGLLGTFELVNMCVSIPHPLNLQPEVADILSVELAESLAKLQEALQESDSEAEDEDEGAGEAEAAATQAPLDLAASGQLFENVIGTALCEALAFTNHSCLPNCRVEFASGSQFEANGPGLWLYCVSRRPLVPGDEVLMAYVPSVVGKPLEERQKKMKKFGFACNCRTPDGPIRKHLP